MSEIRLRPIHPRYTQTGNPILPVGVPLASVSSCITVVEPVLTPFEISAPTAIYTFPKINSNVQACRSSFTSTDHRYECKHDDNNRDAGDTCHTIPLPSAPIYVINPSLPTTSEDVLDQGRDFALGGAQFQLLVGTLNTKCNLELARVTFLPGSGLPLVRLCVSDAWLSSILGTVLVQVNGVVRPLTPGSFIYIHAGSTYAVSTMTSDTAPAMILLGFLRAGPMGFYRHAADLLAGACMSLEEDGEEPTISNETLDVESVAIQLAQLASCYGLRAC